MVTCLLDTNIVVDLYRGYTPAQTWITAQSTPGISRMVTFEVVEGAQNNRGLRQAMKLLADFEIVELTLVDFEWATRQLIKYHLSHNVDAFDCLIAAPSHRLGLPLYTRNLKHFAPLLGNLAQEPY